MPYEFAPGSTGRSVQFLLRDSTTAQGKTGLTAASAGASAKYIREQGLATSFSLVDLASANAAHQDGGFFEVSDALYRLDVPDNALAAGVNYVSVLLEFDGTLLEGVLVFLRNPTNNVGAGAVEYCVTIDDGSNPLAEAEVWVSTDEAGTNVIAGTLTTDANGQATFMLDAGSYYLWVKKTGYTFSNPQSFTVTAS